MKGNPTSEAANRTQGRKGKAQIPPVPDAAYSGRQLCLFQEFLAKTEQRDELSNAIDLWDCVPRYVISRASMNNMRTANGHLEVLEIPFNYQQRKLTAIIYPARIIDDAGRRISFYPSAREELIEHALRKLASEQQAGFFYLADYRSGVRFSLYRLRQELEQQGHSMRYDELTEGLDILSLSTIEIKANDGKEGFARSAYLGALAGVKRSDFEADREARWMAQFHPLLTSSIAHVDYRQFNYRRLMKCRSQLARWLLCQLVLKYTQAARTVDFKVCLSTIRRDSALLSNYTRPSDAKRAVNEAWEELMSLGALCRVDRIERRGIRNKIEDVTYILWPTDDFVREQKAANARHRDGLGANRTDQTMRSHRS